jgi:hypothetical protein
MSAIWQSTYARRVPSCDLIRPASISTDRKLKPYHASRDGSSRGVGLAGWGLGRGRDACLAPVEVGSAMTGRSASRCWGSQDKA